MHAGAWKTVFGLWVAVVVALTTYPWNNFIGSPRFEMIHWIPFYGHPFLPGDVIGNILLFMPVGGLYILSQVGPYTWSLLWKAIFLSLILSVFVEMTQTLNPSRVPTATDVLFNIVGGGIGGWLALGWIQRNSKSEAAPFVLASSTKRSLP